MAIVATTGNVGGLQPVDQNRLPITFPASFTCQDASVSPVTSPVSVGPTTPVGITVPDKAVAVILFAEGDMLFGKASDLSTGTGKFRGGLDVVLPVADLSVLYLKSVSGTVSVYFWFALVK